MLRLVGMLLLIAGPLFYAVADPDSEATEVVVGPAIAVTTPTAPVATTVPIGPTPLVIPEPPPSPVPTIEPAALVALPSATPTPLPTSTPEPTPTAQPTAPPPPTATPAPEPTPTPEPEPTTAPEPTLEPTPELEPEPTPEPEPDHDHDVAGRTVYDVGFRTLALADGFELVLPAVQIEIVGYHEAGHPGAREMSGLDTGVETVVMASRGRGTPPTSAVDIVVPPGQPVVSPVSGVVTSARSYVLYCQYQDQLVYVIPDGYPDHIVRIFHLEGSSPEPGSYVVAGQTIIADSARQLPFESQVDALTGEPSWPHVHLEVVDTRIPDTRPPAPGC